MPQMPSGFLYAAVASVRLAIAFLCGTAVAKQDKYALKVPGGLAFSEFKGYESWQVVSISHSDRPPAFRQRQAFPDGAKMAKIHWLPKQNQYFPNTSAPDDQHDVDLMEDSKRFAESGGWGSAVFNMMPRPTASCPGPRPTCRRRRMMPNAVSPATPK